MGNCKSGGGGGGALNARSVGAAAGRREGRETKARHAKLHGMEVILRIPDDVAERLAAAGGDVSRRALEALALEGYRERALTLLQFLKCWGYLEWKPKTFWAGITLRLQRSGLRSWTEKRACSTLHPGARLASRLLA